MLKFNRNLKFTFSVFNVTVTGNENRLSRFIQYVLETILTSPNPHLVKFDEGGVPSFFEETRSKKDIECMLRAQEGIKAYFKKYISVVFLKGV